MNDEPLVLVVEDEPPLRRFLRTSLSSNGYRLIEAGTAEQALRAMKENRPDLMLLDLGLPDADGIDLTSRLREWTETPIVVISARGREEDKVRAFEAGADDYLTKPFGVNELIARMRVALKHAANDGTKTASVMEFGRLRIDLEARLVTVAGREVHLTPTEYKCLVLLARHAGKVLTHDRILREVWGPGSSRETHYVRVRMAELRKKLEIDPARPRILVTEPGIGYRLKAESTASSPA